MDPVHIFFNELEIDKGNTFTANLSQKNEVENVLSDIDKEYAVTGMIIKPDIVDSELGKIENTKELDRISKEIQELVKSYKDPDLTLSISNSETKTLLLPFAKKDESDLPRIKLTYFNTTTNKNEDFLVYDYYEHLKKIGFTWEHKTLGIKYAIRISSSDNKKIKKKLTMRSDTRRRLCLDSIRVWNMSNAWPANNAVRFRYFYLMGYLEDTRVMESMLGITGLSYDFSSMSISEKNGYLRRYARYTHRSRPDDSLYDLFYSAYNKSYTVLPHLLETVAVRYTSRIHRLFVPKFYHDRNESNFLKGLKYVGEKDTIDEKYFSVIKEFGRKLYEYNKDPKNTSNIAIQTKSLDWAFPEKYYKSIGYTVHGFTFAFPKMKTSISDIINPKNDLINVENGLEEVVNGLSTEIFFPLKKNIEDKIAEYNAVPVKTFINEGYFLYNKSFLIKKTFVTAINKTLSIYGSFSHFSGKTTEKEIKLLDASNFLKFFIERKLLKKDLKFQLAHISGKTPKVTK